MSVRNVYACDGCKKVIPDGAAVCQAGFQIYGDARDMFAGECGPTPFQTRHFCPTCRGPALAAAGVALYVERPAEKGAKRDA